VPRPEAQPTPRLRPQIVQQRHIKWGVEANIFTTCTNHRHITNSKMVLHHSEGLHHLYSLVQQDLNQRRLLRVAATTPLTHPLTQEIDQSMSARNRRK
jgi:hypothetical protein